MAATSFQNGKLKMSNKLCRATAIPESRELQPAAWRFYERMATKVRDWLPDGPMRLTRHTDYALRILVYLAVRPDFPTLASRSQIAEAYEISEDHVAKITAELAELGYVETVRGRSGGLRLGKDADAISIGEVVRRLEPNFDLADCMSEEMECPISAGCGLRHLLRRARAEFLGALDQFTLADITRDRDTLRGALDLDAPQPTE